MMPTTPRGNNVDDQELERLSDPETWDFAKAEVQHPTKPARAVVSVAFQRSDFDRVTELARQHGMRTSEYIREAALGRVVHRRPPTGSLTAGGGVRQANFTAPASPRGLTVETRSGAVLAER